MICRSIKLNNAYRIFTKMKENGIISNAFTYGILIEGMCKDKKDDVVDFI